MCIIPKLSVSDYGTTNVLQRRMKSQSLLKSWVCVTEGSDCDFNFLPVLSADAKTQKNLEANHTSFQ